MGRGATKNGEARERLLAAADELFYHEGVHVVGVDKVIAKAGVAKGSLYYIFGSKDGLVKAYLANRHVRWTQRVEDHLAAVGDPRDRILSVFDVLDELLQEPDYHGCAFLKASAEAEDGSAEKLGTEAFRAWLDELFLGLARAADVAEPELVGRQLVLLYDGAVRAEMDHARYAPGALAKGIARTMLAVEPAWQRAGSLAVAP